MQFLNRWATKVTAAGEWIGVTGILIMTAVTCLDVAGAKLLTMPVPGSTEIISLVQVATIVFAVAATYRHKGHISVEMFVNKMNPTVKSITKFFITLLSLTLFLLLVCEAFQLGNEYLASGEVTATIQLPFYPFAYAFSIALIPMVMLLLIDLVNEVKEIIS